MSHWVQRRVRFVLGQLQNGLFLRRHGLRARQHRDWILLRVRRLRVPGWVELSAVRRWWRRRLPLKPRDT
jgi:hypothetical protein